MKKVLAIVISLVMVLSLTSVAFAAEIAPGQVYFGVKEDIYANPGDTVTVDLQFAADAAANEGYDMAGTLVIPVNIYAGDIELGPFVDFKLSDEAIGAGATLNSDDPDNYICDADMILAEIRIPAIYLFSTDMILAEVTVQVSEDWSIVDYKAETDISIFVDGSMGAYVESDDGNIQEVVNFTAGSGIITYQYQPTASERLVERLKEMAKTIIELIKTGLAYLETLLKPADWNIK